MGLVSLFLFFLILFSANGFPPSGRKGGHAYSKIRKGEFSCGLQFKSRALPPISPRGDAVFQAGVGYGEKLSRTEK